MGVRIAIPTQVKNILLRLQDAGHTAYAVGGCVRDSLLGKTPADWDICTSARPEQTQACFERCLLTGAKYGTVTVLQDGEAYEVTTYRTETGYADSRHPDAVEFLDALEGDLARRDFTVNAMAADADGRVTDLFGGAEDLNRGIIRCVGTPIERFTEDALRILRALRFASRYGFQIEKATAEAIHSLRDTLTRVAAERLHKELSGLLVGKGAEAILREFSDVLCVMIPEIAPCIGFLQQNPRHKWDVFAHTLCALSHTPQDEILRLAILFHDIGKPACFSLDEKGVGHFYGHAEQSARLCAKILRRLRYDGKTAELVTELVRAHDLYLQGLTDKGLRRHLANYGEEQLRRLLRIRRADALGTGTADAEGLETELAHLAYRIDAMLASENCFSIKDLNINGRDLMALGIPQGKQLGALLQQLFDAVLEERCANDKQELVKLAQFLYAEQDSN